MREQAITMCAEMVALERALSLLSQVLPENDPQLDEAWDSVQEAWEATASAQRDLRRALQEVAA